MDGNQVVEYKYDSWGNTVSITGTLADTASVLTASTRTLTNKNLYVYCDNNSVGRVDTEGKYWETAFDVFSWGITLGETIAGPTNLINWLALVGDTIDILAPFGGIGEAIKTCKVFDKGSDALDAAKSLDKGIDIVKPVHGNSLKATKGKMYCVGYGFKSL